MVAGPYAAAWLNAAVATTLVMLGAGVAVLTRRSRPLPR